MHSHDTTGDNKKKAARVRRKAAERSNDVHNWGRDTFFHDLNRATRITQSIERDPAQAAALDRSRKQARKGDVVSEADFDAEAGDD